MCVNALMENRGLHPCPMAQSRLLQKPKCFLHTACLQSHYHLGLQFTEKELGRIPRFPELLSSSGVTLHLGLGGDLTSEGTAGNGGNLQAPLANPSTGAQHVPMLGRCPQSVPELAGRCGLWPHPREAGVPNELIHVGRALGDLG